MKNILLEMGGRIILFMVAKNLAKLCLCSNVLRKVELLSNEIEDVALLLLADDNEAPEKRNDLKDGISEAEPKDLENFQLNSVKIL